jgi:flagellar biosynthesis protein FlhG
MAFVWPIGGGKGGSGKSFLTSSLGRLSAKAGKKTLIIDLDLGAANLHTLVGVPYPEKGFSDFLQKRIPLLEDTVIKTPFENLFLISGARDNFDIANLPYAQKVKTLRAIAKIDYDRILLDLGAGTSFNTLDFFLISRNGIFITTPEPTSIENVYRLIRSIYFRLIRYCFTTPEFKSLGEEIENRFGEGAANRPDTIMNAVALLHPDRYEKLQDELASFRFKLVINQMRRYDNASLGPQISRMVEKHLGLHLEFAGNVAYDDHVHDAICQQASFVDRYPYTKTALDLQELSRQIVEHAGRQLSLRDM